MNIASSKNHPLTGKKVAINIPQMGHDKRGHHGKVGTVLYVKDWGHGYPTTARVEFPMAFGTNLVWFDLDQLFEA